MNDPRHSALAAIITTNELALIDGWIANLLPRLSRRDKVVEAEISKLAIQLLPLLSAALNAGGDANVKTGVWDEVRHLLGSISQQLARQGFSPTDTASFIFALKEPLFSYIRTALASQLELLADQTTFTSTLFDNLGLHTIDNYQKARETIIQRQQQELLELSTPVVQLWKGVLALPLIGTLDSARTQIVMENLLQKIVETGSLIAIIDITGVPTVDTLVAQHLLKTIAATRLMGADCIISGIRPQIAQTIVHLGVNLDDVITKATLADAFQVALKKAGTQIIAANE
jgi:rsbT co-antagonist protein RsbR